MKFAALYPEATLSLSIIDSVSETDPIMEYLIDTWISAAESGDGKKFFNVLVPSLYSTDFIEKNREFLKDRARATKKHQSGILCRSGEPLPYFQKRCLHDRHP